MPETLITNDGATPAAVARLHTKYPSLPVEYLSFLSRSNGAEGDLGIDPGWFVVWPAEEAVLASDEYELPTYLPGHFAFGGNGGGELFVIPLKRNDLYCPVLMVPAIGMASEYLRMIAASFAMFEAAIGRRWVGA